MARTKRQAPPHAPLYDQAEGRSQSSPRRRPYDQEDMYGSARRAAEREPEIITRSSAGRRAARPMQQELITRRRPASAGQKEQEIVIPLAATQGGSRGGDTARKRPAKPHTEARGTHRSPRTADVYSMGYDDPDDAPARPLRDRGAARVRRARRRRALVISTLLVLAVAVWALFVYVFKIGTISVEGNSIYNQSVITECFGQRVGDNLFSFGRKAAADRIAAALPYLETVTVHRALPDRVIIRVTPSTEAYCFVGDAGPVITSPTLKVLRQGDNIDGLLEITGLALAAQSPGQQLVITDEAQAAAVTPVLQALEAGALPGVTRVDISDIYDITLRCQGRFIVRLGTTVELEYKLKLVAETIGSRLEPDATGVVDVSGAATSRAAYYTPQPITDQ